MKPETRIRWTKIIKKQESSGLSVRQFCCSEQISESSFYRNRKLLSEESQPEKETETGQPDLFSCSPDSDTEETDFSESSDPFAEEDDVLFCSPPECRRTVFRPPNIRPFFVRRTGT